MAADFTVDPRCGLVRVTVREAVPPAEAIAFYDAVLGHADYRPGFGFLFDRRQVSTPAQPQTVRIFVEYAREHARSLAACRFAIVTAAGEPTWPWRTAEQLLTHYTRISFEIFDDYDLAESWVVGSSESPS
jgi:hypothetical protein